MANVFISYTAADRDRVTEIAKHLQQLGLDVWFDQEIETGAEWARDVAQRLKESQCVVVCWSPRSVESDWVMWEAAHAQAAGKLVPVFIEPTLVPGPLSFVEGAHIEAWKGAGDDPEWGRLLSSIERMTGRKGLVASENARAQRKQFLDQLGPGGPTRRILSLDAGGLRTAVMFGFLERIETLLAERYSRHVRLSDYFDLIGGASFGAAVATSLAKGLSVREAFRPLLETLPSTVSRSRKSISGSAIAKSWTEMFGNKTMGSEDWKTLVAICATRADTGSSWMITNNSLSLYWSIPGRGNGTEHLPVANAIAASIANPGSLAPFASKTFEGVGGSTERGTFVDPRYFGYADPALQLYSLAILPAFALRWSSEPGSLLIFSVGHGVSRIRQATPTGLLEQMATDSVLQSVRTMQTVGHMRRGWRINSEIGDMAASPIGGRQLFTYRRLDVQLDVDNVKRLLGRPVSAADLAKLIAADRNTPANLAALVQIGQKAAEEELEDSDFPPSFDPQALYEMRQG